MFDHIEDVFVLTLVGIDPQQILGGPVCENHISHRIEADDTALQVLYDRFRALFFIQDQPIGDLELGVHVLYLLVFLLDALEDRVPLVRDALDLPPGAHVQLPQLSGFEELLELFFQGVERAQEDAHYVVDRRDRGDDEEGDDSKDLDELDGREQVQAVDHTDPDGTETMEPGLNGHVEFIDLLIEDIVIDSPGNEPYPALDLFHDRIPVKASDLFLIGACQDLARIVEYHAVQEIVFHGDDGDESLELGLLVFIHQLHGAVGQDLGEQHAVVHDIGYGDILGHAKEDHIGGNYDDNRYCKEDQSDVPCNPFTLKAQREPGSQRPACRGQTLFDVHCGPFPLSTRLAAHQYLLIPLPVIPSYNVRDRYYISLSAA